MKVKEILLIVSYAKWRWIYLLMRKHKELQRKEEKTVHMFISLISDNYLLMEKYPENKVPQNTLFIKI